MVLSFARATNNPRDCGTMAETSRTVGTTAASFDGRLADKESTAGWRFGCAMKSGEHIQLSGLAVATTSALVSVPSFIAAVTLAT